MFLQKGRVHELVEGREGAPADRVTDRRMVDVQEVEPAGQLVDGLIRECLEGSRGPLHAHVGPHPPEFLRGGHQTAQSPNVLPRDPAQDGHAHPPGGKGNPSTPTSSRVRCHRPRFAVNMVVPRKARFVGWAKVWAVQSRNTVSTRPEGSTRRTWLGS